MLMIRIQWRRDVAGFVLLALPAFLSSVIFFLFLPKITEGLGPPRSDTGIQNSE